MKYWSVLKNNTDARRLSANVLYLTLLKIAEYLLPLITIPYLSRVIGVDGLGAIAFAAAVVLWLQTISDWGFNYSATRDVARIRDDKNAVSEIFSNVFWARCMLMVVSLLILSLLILCFDKFYDNRIVLLLTFLLIPGRILFPEWYFQAIEQMKYVTILNLLTKGLFTAAIFVFIKRAEDYFLQPLFLSIGYIVSGIIAMFIILKKKGVHLKRPSISKCLKTIANSTDIFINNLMPNLYNSFSVVLLGLFAGASSFANGIYDAGKKFTTVANSLLETFGRAFFPFLARKMDKHNIYVLFTMILSFVATVLLFLLAPIIIKVFYGEAFSESIVVLRITAPAIIFVSLNNVYGTNYLILNNKETLLRNITIVVSLTGFVAGFPLIYFYNYTGAALTFLLSSVLTGIAPAIFAIRIKHKKRILPTNIQ